MLQHLIHQRRSSRHLIPADLKGELPGVPFDLGGVTAGDRVVPGPASDDLGDEGGNRRGHGQGPFLGGGKENAAGPLFLCGDDRTVTFESERTPAACQDPLLSRGWFRVGAGVPHAGGDHGGQRGEDDPVSDGKRVHPVSVSPLATILRCGDDDPVAAILAPLSVIALWWVSTHGKGAAALRLAAWGSAVIVVLVLVSFKDPAAAGALVTGWFTGISEAVTGLGHFLGDVFGR